MLSYLVLLLTSFRKRGPDTWRENQYGTQLGMQVDGQPRSTAAAVPLWQASRAPQLCSEPKNRYFPSLPFLTHLRYNETFCLQKAQFYFYAHKIT